MISEDACCSMYEGKTPSVSVAVTVQIDFLPVRSPSSVAVHDCAVP
jgi:hypothetical protein